VNLQLFALKGLNFSYYATQAILLPFLPLYFAGQGYSAFQVGLLMMIGPFAAMFAQPLWGYVSDRLNTVKKIILLLWVLTIVSSIGLFYAEGFLISFIFALLLFFFMIPSVPLLDSITIQSTERMSRSYGSVRLWGSVGFTLIALVSGTVLGFIGGIDNIQYIYWALWIVPMMLLIFLKDEPSNGARVSLQSLRSIFRNGPFLWFLLMVFVIMIPHRMNDGLLVLYLNDLGATDTMVGWAWALAAISEIPTFALLARYMHRFHELALLGIVSILYTIRWAAYAWTDEPWLLLYLQASHSITFAAFWIVSIHYAVRLVPQELRSTGQSLLSAVFLGLAGITGGLIGGWINGEWGGSAMYSFGAVLTFISSILLLGTHAYYRKRKIAVEN
jgi:PPP family 3-phenylpropionic acid transporter